MSLAYYSEFPKEWLADTAHLTSAEKGIYADLKALIWEKGRECRLPGDDSTVARLLGLSVREWRKHRSVLVDGDFPLLAIDTEGRLYSPRLLEIYQGTLDKSIKARNSARFRWEQGEPVRHANADANGYAIADANASVSHADRISVGDANADASAHANQIQNQNHNQRSIRERVNNIPAPAREATLMGERFVVTEKHLEMARSIGWKGTLKELQLVANKFRTHFRNKGTPSYDWDAEFETWMWREVRMYPPSPGVPRERWEEVADRDLAAPVVHVVPRREKEQASG